MMVIQSRKISPPEKNPFGKYSDGEKLRIVKSFAALRKNKFARSVTVLVGGTAFAQIITIVALPLLTRLYGPDDFALLAVYTAALGMISVVGCLRLDIAIPLPENDLDAANLLVGCLIIAALFGVLLAAVVLIWPQALARLLGQPKIESYLWLLPLGVWLASSYSALQFWATRKKNFNIVARTRMGQSLLGTATQIGCGFLMLGPLGLLLGQLMLSGAGTVSLIRSLFSSGKSDIFSVNKDGIKKQIIDYKNFPKYSTLEALSNSAATQLPIIIIATVAVSTEAGYLLLAMRIMSGPMRLIGRAVGQVYLSQAPDAYRDGGLGDLASRTVGGLIKIGVGPLIFLGIISPFLFPIIFGAEWERAGELVAWMVPWMILQFIAAPISMSMYVRNLQGMMLALTLFGLMARLSSIGSAYILWPEFISEFYIVSGALFYGVCAVIFLKACQVKVSVLAKEVMRSLPYPVLWLLLGICMVFIYEKII